MTTTCSTNVWASSSSPETDFLSLYVLLQSHQESPLLRYPVDFVLVPYMFLVLFLFLHYYFLISDEQYTCPLLKLPYVFFKL